MGTQRPQHRGRNSVHGRVQRLPAEPNVCPFDYLQCGADDGFGMLLELLQETEKASIIRTAAYLRNLQQAAQADSLSNATWLTFTAVARTPKWPSATLGDRCFFA